MIFKKKIKYRYIKKTKGIISIFLCLILTPCLTLVSSLIEYSRYQNAVQTTKEVVSVSTTSTLSNYDQYVNNRFGLMSVSQDMNIDTTFKKYNQNNVRLMGEAVDLDLNDTNASGAAPLSDRGIMRQQIVDFGETTVLAHSALKDLNIEDIIKRLEDSKIITNLDKITSSTADLTGAVKDLVEEGETFVKKIKDVETKLNDVSTKEKDFVKKVHSLLQTIKKSKNDLSIEYEKDTQVVNIQYTGDEQIKSLNDYIYSLYAKKIDELITAGIALKKSLNSASSAINSLSSAYDNLKEKVDTAKDKLNSLTNLSEGDGNETESEKNVMQSVEKGSDVLKKIVEEISKTVQEQGEKLKEDTIKNIKDAISDTIERIKTDVGIGGAINKLKNLSVDGKIKVIKNLLKGDFKGTISSFLPEGFASFNSAVKTVTKAVNDAITKAAGDFKTKAESSIKNGLKELLETVQKLFHLDVCFNGNLNAVLSDGCFSQLIGEESPNPYVTMLNGVSGIFSNTKDFIESMGSFKFVEALKAIKKVYDSISTVLKAMGQFIRDTVSNISRLFGYITGDIGALYEDYIIDAYAVHNFPNRLNYNSGASLTTFDFNKIPYSGGSNTSMLPSSLLGISSLFDTLSGKSGKDNMFCGAELEYILAGTKSEICNQAISFMNLYMLRLILDLVPIFTDEGVNAMAASATIAAWIVYIAVILGEPFCDTVILVNGGESYLFKGKCYLSPTGIADLGRDIASLATENETVKNELTNYFGNSLQRKMNQLAGGGTFRGKDGRFKADYQTHVLLSLLLSADPEDTLVRIANIIHMESKQYYKKDGKSFSIKKAYTAVKSNTDVTFNAFIDIFKFNGSSMFNKTLLEQRGY